MSYDHFDEVHVVGIPDKADPVVSSVSPQRHRFPHSIVWTPIPVLTWFFPFLGHLGITDTDGIIYDFAAPFTICKDSMAFGWPTMYRQLDLAEVESADVWNKGVQKANDVYRLRVHNLFCDNCHSHVARALNEMGYRGRRNWNMVNVTCLFFSNAKYVSVKHCLISLLPFFLFMGTILTIVLIVVLH